MDEDLRSFSLLFVSNDERELENAATALGNRGERYAFARSIEAAKELFHPEIAGAIIDVDLPDGCGLALYVWLRSRMPGLPVAMLFDKNTSLPRGCELYGDEVRITYEAFEPGEFGASVMTELGEPPFDDVAEELGMTVEEVRQDVGKILERTGAPSLAALLMCLQVNPPHIPPGWAREPSELH